MKEFNKKQLNIENAKALYNALLDSGYSTDFLGDEDYFVNALQNKKDRDMLYRQVAERDDFNIGARDWYENKLTAPSKSTIDSAPEEVQRSLAKPKPASEAASGSASGTQPQPPQRVQGGTPFNPKGKGDVINDMLGRSREVIGGMRSAAEQTRRMVKNSPINPEGRQLANAAEMRRQMLGVQKPMGVTDWGAQQPQSEGGQQQPNRQRSVQSPQAYGTVIEDGEEKVQWLLPDGSVTTDILQADAAESGARGARLQQEFTRRMRQNGLDPTVSADVDRQRELDARDVLKLQLDKQEAANEEARRGIADEKQEAEEKFRAEHPYLWAVMMALNGGQMNNISEQSVAIAGREDLLDAEAANKSEADFINQTKQKFDVAGNGFWKSLGKGLRNPWLREGTYTFGMSDLRNAAMLSVAQQKQERGEELTDAEEALMTTAGISAAADELLEKDISAGYSVGEITSESVPFMVEMGVNPLAGAGEAAMKYAVKRMGVEAVKKLTRKQLMTKVAARVLGDVAGASGMAATTGSLRVLADAEMRRMGDVVPVTDQSGRVVGAKFEGGENYGKALAKAYGAQTIEDWSEMVGEYFSPLLNAAGKGVSKGLRKIGLDKVVDWATNVSNSEIARQIGNFESRVKFNGTIGEWAEEQVGTAANALLIGDNDWSDLVDARQQAITFGGVALMGGTISAIKAGAYPFGRRSAKNKLKQANEKGAKVYGERWSDIVTQFDEKKFEDVFPEQMREAKTQEEREAIVDYGRRLQTWRGYNIIDEKRRIEGIEKVEAEMQNSFDEGADTDLNDMNVRNQIKLDYDAKLEAFKKAFGAEPEEYFGYQSYTFRLIVAKLAGELTEEQATAAIDYLNAKAKYDGARYSYTEGVKAVERRVAEEIGSNVNKDIARLISATMKAGGNEVWVVGGEVFSDAEGKIDVANSTDDIIIKHKNTGKVEFANINDLSTATYMGDVQQLTDEAVANAVAEYERKMKAFTSGNIDTAPGSKFWISGIGSQEIEVTVRGMSEEGNILVTLGDQSQTVMEMSPIALQKGFDAYNWARVNHQATVDAAIREALRKDDELRTNKGTEEQKAAFAVGDEVRIVGSKGGEYRGVITEADADGYTVEIQDEEGNTVSIVRKTADELAAMQPKQDTEDPAEQPKDDPKQPEPQQPIEQQEGVLASVPTDEKGNPLFTEVEPEVAYDAIGEMVDGNEEDRDDIISQSVANLEKQAKESEKAVGRVKLVDGDFAKYKAEKAAARAVLDGVNAELAKWKAIAAVKKQRAEAVLAEQKAAEEAAKAEAKRLEEERKAAEEAERLKDASRMKIREIESQLGAPLDMLDYVMRAIGTGAYKFVWKDTERSAYNTKGLGSHLGLGKSQEERRRRIAFMDNKNGYLPEVAAQRMLEDYDGNDRESYTDQDVLNMILDVMQQYDTPRSIMEAVYKRHEAGVDKEAELDAWYEEQAMIERDQIEAMLAETLKDLDEAATESEINGIFADALIERGEYYDRQERAGEAGGVHAEVPTGEERDGGVPQGTELLPGQQAYKRESGTAGTAGGNGVDAKDAEGGTRTDAPGKDDAGGERVGERIASAEADVDTEPTDKQKEAGNYRKGHVKIGKFDVTIENPKGSVRSGVDSDGERWSNTMNNTYGYIRGAIGVDGDHIDVYTSNDIDNWNGEKVYVIDVYNPDGSFDEHKVMLGFNDAVTAKGDFLKNYDEGWGDNRRLDVSEVNLADFEKWVDSSKRKTKPFAEYKSVKSVGINEEDASSFEIGEFGPIFTQFKGDAKGAIKKLTELQDGEAIGALHHKEIGDIDLVWGKSGSGKSDGYGLAKLVKYHPEVIDRLQEILDDMHIVKRSDNRINLESDTHQAAVRLTWNNEKKTWLLTAFEKKETSEPIDKTTDTDENPSDLRGDTALSQNSDVSESKGSKKEGEKQEGGEKKSDADEEKAIKSKWVNDEDAERFEELRKRLKAKLLGQMNMGVDPEIFSIGVEMSYLMLKKGARKFGEFAKGLIEVLGDEVRPYIKSFYNGARDLPEMAEYEKDMTPYDEVRSFDVLNFDKDGGRADVMTTAEHVSREADAERDAKIATEKLKQQRSRKKNGKKDEEQLVGLFGGADENEAPKIAIPEQRPEMELSGDSAEFQQREMQTAQLVEEVGAVIGSRVEMLRLDPEVVKPMTMGEVKKIASKYPLLSDISDTDLQELVELAMTYVTREAAIGGITSNAEQQRAAYDRIVNMYRIQPSLNARDSERLMKQQYSTPTPFGYVMGQFVRALGKRVVSVLEPSAGNGALTIALEPKTVHANDIDDARLSNLRKLGFGSVTAQNALLPFKGEKVDAVMTNPPFGTVTEKKYDGVFRITSLEGQMAINALESMKDDGRAAIVIGGNTSYRENGSMNPKDAAFFGYLYSHFNVVDVINISGKALYSRNGTGYDVRMILIAGRKSGELKRVYPPVRAKARAEQVTTFDELYKRVQNDIQQIQQVGDKAVDVQREPERPLDRGQSKRDGKTTDRAVVGTGIGGKKLGGTPMPDIEQPVRRNDGGGAGRLGNGNRRDAAGTDDVQRGATRQPGQRESDKRVDNERGGNGGNDTVDISSRPGTGRERLAVKPGLTDEKVDYPSQSGNGFTLLSVVPAAQAKVLQKSLAEIGDVDSFLVEQLGYSSKEELYGYLAAEQIDSVALAIHQMNKGNAFIIGDMTGVGKGRQGAALIRYAVNQGKVPIYFTQKSTLFTDNYRDLTDIGCKDLRPFIIASDDTEHSPYIKDAKGNVIYKLPREKEKKRVFDYIMKNGKLPAEYDYVITVYSQIQNGRLDYEPTEKGWTTKPKEYGKKDKVPSGDLTGQVRRDVIARLAEGNIVILDESHTVGGDSGSGRYMQMVTSQAGGVTFMSATFAKKAENMPIYAQRTAISEAGIKPDELIGAIAKGGVTLQEIMSKQLVESGQMIRRERSFEGVTIDWLNVSEETDRKQRAQFNEVADIFNAIRSFQDEYVKPVIEAMSEEAAERGAAVGQRKGTKDLGVKNVPFASKMYNLVNQLLFALKVDAVSDRVIENLKNGCKPVISFTNTMEGFLEEAPKGVEMDEVPNFSVTLMRALKGVMRYTENDADKNSSGGEISLSALSPEGQKVYNEIRAKIEALSADLPISPMDAIRAKIEDAGYSIAEITGRKLQLNKTADGKYIVEDRKDKDANKSMRDFNSGKLDVLMINKSGSTGISLHASSKFEDQRQRVMVFAQFQSDINDEVQMRGRIDRSGQVVRGKYEYIMSTIPAEQRLQMMFKAKLKSLDANTTSSQKSKFNEMEVVDYLNKYGDEVVWEYMHEHPELEERLGDPLEILKGDNEETDKRSKKEDKSKKEDCAGKISRYLAFLSVEEQDEIFREITEAYKIKMQLLDDAGENDLEITTMPLRAETKNVKLWHKGTAPNSGNAFADNTYVEEVECDVLKKPMKRSEIDAVMKKLMGDLYAEKNGGIDWNSYIRRKNDEVAQYFTAKADEAIAKLAEQGEARIAKLREKAVRDGEKARSRGDINLTDEQIASLAETMAETAMGYEKQKQQRRREEIWAVRQRIGALMQRLVAGAIYVVPQDLKNSTADMFTQTYGTFVGFKFNKNYTLGSSTAVFATLDGRRKVELALNDSAIDTIIQTTEIARRYSPKEINSLSLDNWDSKVPTQTRQKRYIITGNLLQALVDTEKGNGTRGNLISYSTIDGETRQGILMGENFKPSDLRSSATLSSRLAQIKEGKTVVSEDGDVQISKILLGWEHKGDYELRVPKSKQRGGKYTMNDELLSLVWRNNFVTKGGGMVAYVSPENIAKVVDLLSREPFNLTVLEESKLEDTVGDGGAMFRDGEDIEAINERFNKRLNELSDNPQQKDRVLHLGRASTFLQSGGVPNAEILLEYDRLIRKSNEGYKNAHPFETKDIKNLPKAISEPIAVFANTSGNEGHVILTELKKNGKNFIVAIRATKQNRKGGVVLVVNEIVTLFPKEAKGVIGWINNGKATRIDKEKALRFIEALPTHPGTTITSAELDNATKIVKEFENPSVDGVKKSEGAQTDSVNEIKYRTVDIESELGKKLEAIPDDELVETYRNVQLFADDSMGSPMAYIDKETGEVRIIEGGKWDDSNPQKIRLTDEQIQKLGELNENGFVMIDGKESTVLPINKSLRFEKPKNGPAKLKYWLVKNENGEGMWADYNPYNHSIETPLNTQFSTAYKRPNLVVVKCLVPKSELENGFQSDYANLPTGAHQWNNGRTLYLSRYSKIVGVLSRKEEARLIDEYWKNNPKKYTEGKKNTNYECFVPQVRRELEKLGYKFQYKGKWLTTEEALELDEKFNPTDVIDNNVPFITDEDIARVDAKVSGKWTADTKKENDNKMAARVQEIADGLNTPVRIVQSEEEVAQLPTYRKRHAKGWFDTATGEVVIVVPNNENVADVENTVAHEIVAHKGLRKLVGDERFDSFLDDVYSNLDSKVKEIIDARVRGEIDRRAKKMAEQKGNGILALAEGYDEANRQREAITREMTEEYMAELAGKIGERGFEQLEKEEKSLWVKIKERVIKFLDAIMKGIHIKGFKLTDKDLAYILYRSWKNLRDNGSLFDIAEDIAMRSKTGFNEKKEYIEVVNERFNEELTKLTEENKDRIILSFGMPSAKLLSAGVENRPIKLYGNKVIKKMKKHGFALEELRDLPRAVADPIAVFDNYGKEGNRSVLTELKTQHGNILVALDLGKGYEDVDFNIVSSVFGKGNMKIVDWINKGFATYIDKEKALSYLHHSAPIAEALSSSKLYNATKVVKEFENPSVDGDKNVMFRDGEELKDFEVKNRVKARDKYEHSVGTHKYRSIETWQDSMRAVMELYKAVLGGGSSFRIEDVASFENAYQAENAMSSSNSSQQAHYRITQMQPLYEEIESLTKGKKKEELMLRRYLIAKHGLERNEVLARRDAELSAGEKADAAAIAKAYAKKRERDYSGLTTLMLRSGEKRISVAEAEARAAQFVADYESEHDTTELWWRIDMCNKATLKKMLDGGLISRERHDKTAAMFKNYVPLRGFDETTSDEVYSYLAGSEKLNGGTVFKTAYGRNSVADDPIAMIHQMADSAIMQANRNLVKQRLLNFVQNHPSDAVSVSHLWFKYNDEEEKWEPVFCKNINPGDTPEMVSEKTAAFEARMEELSKKDPDRFCKDYGTKKRGNNINIDWRVIGDNLKEHQVLVKRNGVNYILTVNGNPRAAQAINGLTNPDVVDGGFYGVIDNSMKWLKRLQASAYTTLNLNFTMSNFARDMIYSNAMVVGKESPKYIGLFMANCIKYNPFTMRYLFWNWDSGTLDDSKELERNFKEFMLHGGETGFVAVKNMEQYKREARKLGRRTGSIRRKFGHALAIQLDQANRSAENVARFAAYMASRTMGRTIERSVWDAKEVSVNFNKKGSGGKAFGAVGNNWYDNAQALLAGAFNTLIVFFNAGVQGLSNFSKVVGRHPIRSTIGVFAAYALGYLVPALCDGGDGDDDDENAYYNLPEYIRRQNVCVKGDGKWYTMPLPIELRAFYGLGELTYGAVSGHDQYGDGELDLAIAQQMSQVLPLDFLEGGGNNPLHALIPTQAKPIVEAWSNKGWTGLPISKETPWNENDPNWTKAYRNTNGVLVEASKWLNEFSGGDDFVSGWIDLDPGKTEYLLKGYLGGIAQMATQLTDLYYSAKGDKEFDWRYAPIVSRFVRTGDERTQYRKVEEDYFKYLEEYKQTKHKLDSYKDAEKQGLVEYAKKIDLIHNSEEFARYTVMEQYQIFINGYRKQKNEAKGEDSRKLFEAMEREYIIQCVKSLKKADSVAATIPADAKKPLVDYGERYEELIKPKDFNEDMELKYRKLEADRTGDEESAKKINSARYRISNKKKELGTGDDEAVMQRIRDERSKVLEELRKTQKVPIDIVEIKE